MQLGWPVVICRTTHSRLLDGARNERRSSSCTAPHHHATSSYLQPPSRIRQSSHDYMAGMSNQTRTTFFTSAHVISFSSRIDRALPPFPPPAASDTIHRRIPRVTYINNRATNKKTRGSEVISSTYAFEITRQHHSNAPEKQSDATLTPFCRSSSLDLDGERVTRASSTESPHSPPPAKNHLRPELRKRCSFRAATEEKKTALALQNRLPSFKRFSSVR